MRLRHFFKQHLRKFIGRHTFFVKGHGSLTKSEGIAMPKTRRSREEKLAKSEAAFEAARKKHLRIVGADAKARRKERNGNIFMLGLGIYYELLSLSEDAFKKRGNAIYGVGSKHLKGRDLERYTKAMLWVGAQKNVTPSKAQAKPATSQAPAPGAAQIAPSAPDSLSTPTFI